MDIVTEEEEEQFEVLLARLQDSVDSNPDDPSLHFDLGVLLWERGGGSKESREKAAEHFVISAKLNPQNGAAFKYLGHYYSTVAVDAQRALKCYQRAVTLTPVDSESGEALCDLLDHGGKESLEVAVCREAAEKSPRAFWAFRRLGYLLVHQKKWSEAVQSLQHAIRGYPTCAELWEALGLAYQRLGMYTAALKSYGRATELEESRVFSLVESGNILLMTGSFRQGIDQFQLALEISPHSVAAKYGLASALLGLSKECINVGAFRWAASLLEEASEVVKTTNHLSGNISCIWKLQGDIQITYAKCYPWMECESKCDKEAFCNSIRSWKQVCCSAAISAKGAYQRALHLSPWQANIYADIAITSNLISSLHEYDTNVWQLSEKMALGALLLEGDNYEFWVALGCLSNDTALKQHALIRGLHLDVSSAVAWAYLGQLYREAGQKQLARQAFDCARSIDPSLALPWAGMSSDFQAGDPAPDEAFESSLRAVQIMPLAEFQIGLGMIALLSGHLSSPQVYGAIQQAVQHGPHYPESHNLKGLVCEARFDYQSAAAAYKLARHAISISSGTVPKTHMRDVSINLARSLCWAGNALDAAHECEDLQTQGMLDGEGLQIYALSLWKLGKNDQALGVARTLAASISGMEQTSKAASVSFICRLLYFISGLDSAIISIQKMPKEMFHSSRVSFIVSAIHSLDRSSRLETVVSNSRHYLTSHEEITRMHFLIAMGKLVKHGSEHSLGFQSGIGHLRKALHMYPNSNLIRNLLGYLLLSSKKWNDAHVATRCCYIDSFSPQNKEGLKSAVEVFGAGAVACYAVGCSSPMFTFPTCEFQCLNGPGAVEQLQKCLHREPWNHNTSYLLILNLVQKAREEKFPQRLCTVIKRLIHTALSNELYSKENEPYQYQKFQLLLCASELNLQTGNLDGCISHAKNASALSLPASYLFFAHLLLCRAFAAQSDSANLEEEYMRCLELKTEFHIGWACLKVVEYQYQLQIDSDILGSCLELWPEEMKSSWNMWVAVFNLVRGLISLRERDFLSAEKFLSQACSSAGAERSLFLCHGAICMELAREYCDSHFLSLAVRSLTKAQKTYLFPLPIVSTLLAQAEGSLGSKEKWEKNLRLEWCTWSPEMRPAELFFQMHLLASQIEHGWDSSSNVETCQNPQKWVLRAIHTNPSCLRYWEVLQKLVE